MEATQHFFKTIVRGEKLTIDLPEGVEQAEIEVTVRPLYPKDRVEAQDSLPERYYIAQRYKGVFNQDYDPNQYDIYEQ